MTFNKYVAEVFMDTRASFIFANLNKIVCKSILKDGKILPGYETCIEELKLYFQVVLPSGFKVFKHGEPIIYNGDGVFLDRRDRSILKVKKIKNKNYVEIDKRKICVTRVTE